MKQTNKHGLHNTQMLLPVMVETWLGEDEDVQSVQDVAAANRKHEDIAPLLKFENVSI